MKIIEEAVKRGKGLKQARTIEHMGKKQMQALNNKNGKAATCRDQLLKIAALYYENLYASKVEVTQKNAPKILAISQTLI